MYASFYVAVTMASQISALRVAPIPNRRRRVRHKILTPAYASFTGESKGAMLDLYEIVDISEDGVAIRCNSQIEVNRRYNLCLDLAESSGSIYTTGQVIWSNETGRSGLRFSGLAPDSLLRLREWLFLNAMAGVANAEAEAAATQENSAEEIAVLPNYTDTLAAVTAVRREVEALGADLMAALQLIAKRAQTLLRSSGAAIALATEEPDVMVCRACSGQTAPPEGARLQVGSGFSGECVRTGRLLRCDDAETDSRVDRESCRALGLRSILAAPIRLGDKVVGILEVFAPQPYSFTEDDSTVLQRLADTVLAAVNRAARAEAPAAPTAPVSAPFTPSPGSVLFASGPEEKELKERDGEKSVSTLDDDNPGGVRLPRSLLVLLIGAAATIAMALGFLSAPWIQTKFKAPDTRLPTVLASSQPPGTSNSVSTSPLSPTVSTATLEQLRQLAENGDSTAENALGLRYATGEGVKLDNAEAARWFTKSATQGNVAAQYKLALLYWGGHGVPKDASKAYFWAYLARAANHNGGADLVRILANDLTDAQAARIAQEAERWFQQHQASTQTISAR
jgi:putative methionine-R-sulfoxide reductase with GAF domain